MSSLEERRAYARGYSRASAWPDHIPPEPPGSITRTLVASLREVRGELDAMQATLEQNDAFTIRLHKQIDQIDNALARLGEWVKACVGEISRDQS